MMRIIDQVRRKVNSYYDSMKMIKDVIEEEKKKNNAPDKSLEVKLIFDISDKLDKRRYNVPISNEIAAVFIVDDRDLLAPAKGIVIHEKGKSIVQLRPYDRRTESMIYPLFFQVADWMELESRN